MKEWGPWIHAEAEGMHTAPTLLRTIYSCSCDMDSYFQWDSMTHTWGRKKHSAWMTYANAVKFTCWFWRCPLQDISFVILEKKMSVGLFLLGKSRQAICSNITFCFFFKINSGVVSFHYTTILYWNRKTCFVLSNFWQQSHLFWAQGWGFGSLILYVHISHILTIVQGDWLGARGLF